MASWLSRLARNCHLGKRPRLKRRQRRVAGRSCWWLDIVVRTDDTNGKSEMRKGLRGVNPASKPSRSTRERTYWPKSGARLHLSVFRGVFLNSEAGDPRTRSHVHSLPTPNVKCGSASMTGCPFTNQDDMLR